MTTFRDKIRATHDRLSPSFRILANYLLDNTHEAAFLNASQLAKHLDIDPATVVRFAQHLGYPGYPELLAEVRAEVKDDLDRYLNPPPFTEEPGSVVLAAIRREINNLELLERSLPPKDVNRFAGLVTKAQKIVVVGEGVSRELARVFAYKLTSLGLNAYDIDPTPESAATAFLNLERGDLVIGLAASPLCQDVAHALRLAKHGKATVVTIAGAMSWPAAVPADLVIAAPNQSAILTPDFPALGTLLAALYQALWIAQQAKQVKLDKSFNALLKELTQLRNKARTPETAEIMTESPKGA